MSVFKVKKDTDSYSYPIIKIIAFIILIAGSIVVRCSVHIANSGLNTAAGIITVLIVCLSVLCVYLSFAEIIVLHERRKNAKEENGVFSGKTKDVSVTRIVELATKNDIIDIRALSKGKVIKLGASADQKTGHGGFFDKEYYIEDKAFSDPASFDSELQIISENGNLSVVSIDGVEPEKWAL